MNLFSPTLFIAWLATAVAINSLLDTANWRPIASTAPLVAPHLKCRYIFIDKSVYQGGSSAATSRLFQPITNGGPLELNHAHFKYYADDCLSSGEQNILDEIAKVSEHFTLFGLDLSGNRLNDSLLEHVLTKNPVLRYNLNLIKYLDLSDNNLTKLSSTKQRVNSSLEPPPSELEEELNYLNEFYLRPDEEFYLLNRFFNLEVLVLDRNAELAFNTRNILQIFQRLRVLSVNRCELGTRKPPLSLGAANSRQLDMFYLGMTGNELDQTRLGEYLTAATEHDTLQVETLDLSENRLGGDCGDLFRGGQIRAVNKLNLESNLITSLNVNTLPKTLADLNLRFNLIKSTAIDNFKRLTTTDESSHKKVAIKLEGNPLVCDCESKWLMDMADLFAYESQQQKVIVVPVKQQPPPTQTFLSRKKASKNLALLDSSIKLVYRRNINYERQSTRDKTSNYEIKAERVMDTPNLEFIDATDRKSKWRGRWSIMKRAIEEISPHFSLDSDPNLSGSYQMPPRQKRVRFGSSSSVSKPLHPYLNSIGVFISDLDAVTCRFIDTQSFDASKRQANESVDVTTDADMMDSVDYAIPDEATRQNVNANTVRYRTRSLMGSDASDFVCDYADHCRPASECNCCVFLHCHCRSICPAECKCYYDASRAQNIIDCSARGLAEVPNAENPIESATDIRLNGNGLTTVRPHTFFGFSSVKFLYLQDNRISSLGHEAFEDLKYTLKLLNLANNALEYIDFTEVANFVDLEVIVLSRNPLKQIDQYVTVLTQSSLPNLKALYVSKTALSDTALEHLVSHSKANSNVSVKFKLRDAETKTELTPELLTSQIVKTTTEVISTTTLKTASISTSRSLSSRKPKTSRTSANTNSTTPQPHLAYSNKNLEENVFYLLNLTSNSNATDLVKIILNANQVENEETIVHDERRKNKAKSSDHFVDPLDSHNTILFNPSAGIRPVEFDENDDTKRMDRENRFWFLDSYRNKFKYYYFPIGVFMLCVAVSVLVVLIIVFARRQKRRARKQPLNVNDMKRSGGGGGVNTASMNNASYYLEPVETLNEDEEESEEDEDSGHDGDNSEEAIGQSRRKRHNNSTLNGKLRKLFQTKTFKSATCARNAGPHKSGSFDSYESAYNSVDSATVPVSRSIDNLTLNVFVYFSLHDNAYIVDRLLPTLKSCLTIVPETRYILKVQTDQFMESFDYSMTLNPTSTTPPHSSASSSSRNSADLPLMTSKAVNNSLTANVLILSENFHGYRASMPGACSDSLMAASIKIKSSTSTRGGVDGGAHHHSSQSEASTRSTTASNSGVDGGFLTNNFSSSTSTTTATTMHQQQAAKCAQAFKSAFKIHLFNTPMVMQSNAVTLNSGRSKFGGHSRHGTMSVYANTAAVPNDLYNTHAFSEQLQFKLEKYLEHVCLKSNTFSKTNFSYVDYSKR